MTEQRAPQRRPGRPRKDANAPALSRATIGRAALALAADEGFAALTMRTLAERLGVTVRALYHHVADRQAVIDLVATELMALLPDGVPDAADATSGIRALYEDARRAYRAAGRALLFALDETVTPAEVPVERVLAPERMLAFLTAIGLSLPDALAWRSQFLVDVFGFALLIDHGYDRADAAGRRAMQDPVPGPWLHAHPEIAAPLSREAAALPDSTSDELFERMVARAILTAQTMRTG